MVPRKTAILGRAFDSTAASYKYFWFLALLRLLPHHNTVPVRTVVTKMIVIAWAPAAFFRLSFGWHDRLQDAVRDLQSAANLRPDASEARIRTALSGWREAEARIDALSQLVPTRFLAPWLTLDLSPAIRDDRRTRAILRKAAETAQSADGPPYWLEREANGYTVAFGPGWRDWLLEHRMILQGYAEFALARFLQARNPHVPGITEKVRMPGGRKLAPARRVLERYRGQTGSLLDAYTGRALGHAYAIDHVLPRAFVAHDLLWNLVPTEVALNRSKGDLLPDSSLLPMVARHHFCLVQTSAYGAAELENYSAVFGMPEEDLRGLVWEAFVEQYSKVLSPMLQIAASQGFRAHWRPSGSC